MSYEQKYLKYKQKYLDLKALIHNEQLQTLNEQAGGFDSEEFNLTHLGTTPESSPHFKGGNPNFSSELPPITDSSEMSEQAGGKKQNKKRTNSYSSSSSSSDSDLSTPMDSEISISSTESISSDF
jgi:hypothetical protein